MADLDEPSVPVLSDGTVTLRALGESDIEGVREQGEDLEVQRWTSVPVPFRQADARELVLDIAPAEWRNGAAWTFAVEAPGGRGAGRYAGTVVLRDQGFGRAEIGFASHPGVRRTGVMYAALRLLLDWGFAVRRLETIIWWSPEGNWGSRRIAWRLGFSYDGLVHRWVPQRGEPRTSWVGTLLSSDARLPRNAWLDAPRVVGERAALRPFHPVDATRVAEACGDERTAYWLSDLPSPYTLAWAEAYLGSRPHEMALGQAVHWAVADPRTDTLVGAISLSHLQPGRDAEVGYWSHPAARGKGVMTDACRLAVRHAFVPEQDGGLGLHRVHATAAEGNTASRHVLESAGFTDVGRERKSFLARDGSRADQVAFDLLVTDHYTPS